MTLDSIIQSLIAQVVREALPAALNALDYAVPTTVADRLSALEADNAGLRQRLADVEGMLNQGLGKGSDMLARIASLEGRIDSLCETMHITSRFSALSLRCESLEGRTEDLERQTRYDGELLRDDLSETVRRLDAALDRIDALEKGLEDFDVTEQLGEALSGMSLSVTID